jgi:hypothetical protein
LKDYLVAIIGLETITEKITTMVELLSMVTLARQPGQAVQNAGILIQHNPNFVSSVVRALFLPHVIPAAA